MHPRILKSISVLLFSLFFLPFTRTFAQENEVQKKAEEKLTDKPAPVFAGVAVSADLVGIYMKLANHNYVPLEVSARLNFKEKYFPVFELGYGESDYQHEETNNTYRTKAPYFRIGMDYNFKKNWRSGSRLFAGVRYAFTSFNYDIASPGFSDPVWNQEYNFNFKGLHANSHWGELIFGLETRLWSIFRLGWDVRYKVRISHSESSIGSPWYVPGFGKFGSTCLGGSFRAIFDI